MKNERPSDGGIPLAFSSNDSAWSGFLVEEHQTPETGFEDRWEYPKSHIVLHTQGRSRFSYRENGGRFEALFEPDTISILPEGYETSFSWEGAFRAMVVELDTELIKELFPPDRLPTQQSLIPSHGVRDQQLAALLRSIEVAIRSKGSLGKLYSESLSLALASYVFERYSAGNRMVPAPSGLSRVQSERLRDYINENLDKDLRLPELAALVNLSPSYFCRVFRDTFNATPHQYVVKERIKLAKRLLRTGDIRIVDVAHCLGFASQSHFASVFKRHTGTSPRQFRRAVRFGRVF